MGRQLRLTCSIALLLIASCVLVPRLNRPEVLGIDDFVEYWSAGRLNVTGGNPYSPAELFLLQKSVGLSGDQPILMWNPPWTLTFVMPFGLISYAPARILWLITNTLVILGCAALLWSLYGGSREAIGFVAILALSYCPTLIVLRMGQIAPLILLGLTGFLCFVRRKQDWLAGVFLVIATIKPHLVYLVGLAILLWSIRERRWGVLAGAAAAGIIVILMPLATNPEVAAQYLTATKNTPPIDWITTSFGTLLRVCFAPEWAWLHFIPSLMGVVWLSGYWWSQRDNWDWMDQLPLVLVMSYVTASFGWFGDQVALLIALVPCFAWLRRDFKSFVLNPGFVIYVVLNVAALVGNILYPAEQLWLVWAAPAVLTGYLYARRRMLKRPDGAEGSTTGTATDEREAAYA